MKSKTAKNGLNSTSVKTSDGGSRPPIVVILGHIDHGKTTLLSKIKEMDLTKKEHGGITQHIAAYQVEVSDAKNEIRDTQKEKRLTSHVSRITFIDTPGHSAFNNLRARGAKVADLAILVIAANEGVKPQTLESLKFIKEAGLNYLVALNKIDLPESNLEKAKMNLVENGILIEGYGGDTVVVPISAKEGKGINELLEMISLLAEMMNLKGSPEAELEAVVIESKIDSRRGPLATILVRNGSLSLGEGIKVEKSFGKIKAMFNEYGQEVTQVLPSQPVEILGFKTVPTVGGLVTKTEGEETVIKPVFKTELSLDQTQPEEKKLKIILKADMEGTLEAIKANLPEGCLLIKGEVGEVNDSDVLSAIANQGEIVAFNVKVNNQIKKMAEREKIKISSYNVIYELLENLEHKILRILEPTIDETVLGRAEIIAEFKMRDSRIAGCRITEGEIKKTDNFHLYRGKELIGDFRLKSLKKGKQDIDQAKVGEECGMLFSGNLDFNLGDMLVSYRKVQP